MKKNNAPFSLKAIACGLAVGVVNGLFGAGGGMLAVPFLKAQGLDQKSAHANAVAIILPITAVSAVTYAVNGFASLNDALIYMPTGIVGALIGTYIITKISPLLLRGIFAAFMIYAGIRLLIR